MKMRTTLIREILICLVATPTLIICGIAASAQNLTSNQSAAATVKIDVMPIPTRYFAALPSTLSEINLWAEGSNRYPPTAHVVDSLLAGNPQMLAKLSWASQRVPAAEREQWAIQWSKLFRFETGTAAFCNPARQIIYGPPTTLRRALVHAFVEGGCAKTGDRETILRADTPAATIVEYYSPWRHENPDDNQPEFDPRLTRAARLMIFTGDSSDARQAAFIMVEQKDPRAEAALLAIYPAIKDEKLRDQVALAFLRGKSVAGKSLASETCQRLKSDPACSPANAFNPKDFAAAYDEPPVPDLSKVKARIKALKAMGFAKVAKVDPMSAKTLSAEVILDLAGYLYSFDVETGLFPNHHDSLMRRLAALVEPSLNGAVFEETPPTLEGDEKGAPYQIRLFVGGKQYETQAENLDDWYDVTAVLRLLNTALTDRRSDQRFFPLVTTDQTLNIVGAPKLAIAQAVVAGLIKAGDERQAEKLGKDFENQLREKLKAQLKQPI